MENPRNLAWLAWNFGGCSNSRVETKSSSSFFLSRLFDHPNGVTSTLKRPLWRNLALKDVLKWTSSIPWPHLKFSEASHWKHSKAPATSGVHPAGRKAGGFGKTRDTRLRAIKKSEKVRCCTLQKVRLVLSPKMDGPKLNRKHWTKISLTERHAICIYNTL